MIETILQVFIQTIYMFCANLKLKKRLEDRSAQMRLVQRRFFVKMEDKKPGALDAITMLFKSTHTQIVDILKEMEKSKESLTRYC